MSGRAAKKKRKAERARVKKKMDIGSNPLVQEIYPLVSKLLPPAADGKKNVELHMKSVKVAAGPRIKPGFKNDMRKMAKKGNIRSLVGICFVFSNTSAYNGLR